jgi:hypothetical protein
MTAGARWEGNGEGFLRDGGEEVWVVGGGAGDFVEGCYGAELDGGCGGVGAAGVVLYTTADNDGGEDIAVAGQWEGRWCNGLGQVN